MVLVTSTINLYEGQHRVCFLQSFVRQLWFYAFGRHPAEVAGLLTQTKLILYFADIQYKDSSITLFMVAVVRPVTGGKMYIPTLRKGNF